MLCSDNLDPVISYELYAYRRSNPKHLPIIAQNPKCSEISLDIDMHHNILFKYHMYDSYTSIPANVFSPVDLDVI